MAGPQMRSSVYLLVYGQKHLAAAVTQEQGTVP
jgi:hypothetical protein